MCLEVFIRHKKRLLLVLLWLGFCSVIYYLHSLKLVKRSLESVKLVNEDIQQNPNDFESLVITELGALGRPARGNWTTKELKEIQRWQKETGFNAWLSERISPERSLFDMRHRSCKKLKYPVEKLPAISIVITYHNEQTSVLLRTLSSIRDRTPIFLLREIILIDDGSSNGANSPKFIEFLMTKYPDLVKHQRLNTQVGLMKARVVGAQQALADILIFLDAHVEVTKGWLEPLLTPILRDNRTCTTPIIDTIDFNNFAYKRATPSRGFFDWHFNYIQLPLLKEEYVALPAPHENPIMNGGLFAISRQWFFDLGSYDEGLRLWGGEQFELSLKIWLCGGTLLEVPCSRVGHLYRDASYKLNLPKEEKNRLIKAENTNYRRVAEIWLDDYKDKLFVNMPQLTVVKAGSLKKQFALKKRLACKPFSWFLSRLASDFLAVYPILEERDYAFGAIQSIGHSDLCLDRSDNSKEHPQLLRCDIDLKYPKAEQRWSLRSFRDVESGSKCLERRGENQIWLFPCHKKQGNQFWFYNQDTKQLIQGQRMKDRQCLEADLNAITISANSCDEMNLNQKWNLGYVNETLMRTFWENVKQM
ncbi:polypeptide N-acetylgalactosaminyltransferase 8 [Drosophila tropicalis]|uniref:polypeptide N-acetylgalactosaminyltransferase 8 n=1 Tax=Drosophila tropicalis TaxID=46794 RepID=UPI0035AB89DF